MCRINGFWDFNTSLSYDGEQVLKQMRDTLYHGGPDSFGEYYEETSQLGLGHRRLSILDLSAAGHQPMHWKQWTVVFNGEIYNFEEIKEELKSLGFTFATGSDTEMILKAYEAWGEEMLEHFRGMFAIAIWDREKEELLLIRDRLGVKPLYWYQKDNLFMFASELKAFHEHPLFDKSIDFEALSLFLQQGYIPQPHCIFKYAHKLNSAGILRINAQGKVKQQTYWSVEEIYKESSLSNKTEEELLEELEQILTESFELRMVADVPVGSFLSGGIDSSLVTALLQKKAGRKLKTFTIGFHHEEYNEAHHAKAIAEYLGTEHRELYCSEKDFKRLIPQLPELYDEPFGDSSGIPTYLVAEMAKKEVKVSLSADGGDEIFGGYTKYEICQQFFPKIKRIPKPIRKGLTLAASRIDPWWLERNAAKIPVLKNYKNISNKFPKLRNALSANDVLEFFNLSSSYITKRELEQIFPYFTNRYQSDTEVEDERLLSYLGMIDMQTYLEGDIMTKVDRATMHNALEGREPFLDHKIIEFALQLPDKYKIQGKDTKYLLRKLLYKYVPKELIERPKQGFSIPIQEWMHSLLKEDILNMGKDEHFLTIFAFDTLHFQKLIDNFLSKKTYVNPSFMWFLYTLYRWYLRWIKE